MGKKQIRIKLRSPAAKAVYKELADLRGELDSILARDPAAANRAEVLLLYSGVHALLLYRLAHRMQKKGMIFPARALSQFAKFVTGIEIHPGAEIGKGLFIDHGAGVVIGETSVIGDYCTIYQGVTLGGTGKQTGKRHPTIGDNVMIGAGAKLLGNFTVGSNAKIAAGAVVLHDVPENATAVGVPARVVKVGDRKIPDSENKRPGEVFDLDQVNIPDPTSHDINMLMRRVVQLEKTLGIPPEEDSVYPDGSGI